MTNREIANTFNLLGKIMDLHGENQFKTRSYTNAYLTIRKLPESVFEMPIEALQQMRGIGKAITEKILELKETGELKALNEYFAVTPPGIVDMLKMKGFGPKKIKTIWAELGIETPGELLYACDENRLVDLKGFGAKTQDQLKKQLKYFLESQGKFLYGRVVDNAIEILNKLQDLLPEAMFDFTGDLDRKMPVVSSLQMLTTADESILKSKLETAEDFEMEGGQFRFRGIPFVLEFEDEENFAQVKFQNSCSDEFLDHWNELFGEPIFEGFEEDLFDALDLAYIPSECRENPRILERAQRGDLSLIDDNDIKGLIHAHSTYSDGVSTLREMVEAAKSSGYSYMLITDHSKSAFYADGLDEDRLIQQWKEVDELNTEMHDFVLFKGIESDILNDGSLDYDRDVLKQFDCIIASVHSNLKMDLDKAMSRLITAVENPYTRILGHCTGRLLLSREGYPVDHKKLIDACISNGVVIEINANSQRLDIDWQWIDHIMEKDGMVSVNPDAHSVAGIADTKFGIIAARKGGLMPEYCLNTKSAEEFMLWLESNK